MSCTNLKQETETTHVSFFQLLLFSHPAVLRLLAELLTSGVDHSADIRAHVRADVRDFAFDAF